MGNVLGLLHILQLMTSSTAVIVTCVIAILYGIHKLKIVHFLVAEL